MGTEDNFDQSNPGDNTDQTAHTSRFAGAAWVNYPCELLRPRFAHIPHEVDWVKLYELRKQQRQSLQATCARDGA